MVLQAELKQYNEQIVAKKVEFSVPKKPSSLLTYLLSQNLAEFYKKNKENKENK